MTESAAGTAPAPTVAWHSLTPTEALERQGVTLAQGLTSAEADTRRAKYGPNKFAEAAKEPRWQAFVRQYKDPMQIVLLAAGILSLFIPNQVATGVVLIALTLLNAAMGLSQEGKASASVAALQKMMVVKAKARRDGELVEVADGRPGARRHREHRGRRPRPRGRADPDRRHPRDRRVGADRRERPGPEAGRGGRGRRGPRRPDRPCVHEHAGDARRGHDPRRRDRHVDRGRPHQRHAPADQGRGHAAHPPAQRADQPDPRHRGRRAADLAGDRPLA